MYSHGLFSSFIYRWASSSGLNFKYRLVSLITHVGPSPNCGHYTAIGEAPNGTYYRLVLGVIMGLYHAKYYSSVCWGRGVAAGKTI